MQSVKLKSWKADIRWLINPPTIWCRLNLKAYEVEIFRVITLNGESSDFFIYEAKPQELKKSFLFKNGFGASLVKSHQRRNVLVSFLIFKSFINHYLYFGHFIMECRFYLRLPSFVNYLHKPLPRIESLISSLTASIEPQSTFLKFYALLLWWLKLLSIWVSRLHIRNLN